MPDLDNNLPTFAAHLIGTEFRERYDIECPTCGKKLSARPSIFMTGFGINSGGGNCPGCKSHFHLAIGDDGEMYSSIEAPATESEVAE